ncbi:MAG: alpha-isopropylmalate synthase regulatory domain-containing protein [bacterium]|nr:alpha-isopropylmalate synthase regulatory domain-containing protein [bacterium]
MRRILLNDVALRESAQVEGGSMSPQDQLTYVKMLIDGGIDRIEIGYPYSSQKQMENCQRIVKFVNELSVEDRPLLGGLTIALEKGVMAVKEAGCDLCHIYIPTSDELLLTQFYDSKYGDTKEGKQQWYLNTAERIVRYARSIGFEHVEFSPEDAARTEIDFLCEIVETVIDAGATVVNIPDTTGLRIGDEFGSIIKTLFERVSNIADAHISVHCHNDSDHATNNALQAILRGASIVEGTFFGLGERSGMTKFESILWNLATRSDCMQDIRFVNLAVNFDISHCCRIVHFIANKLGMTVPRHWPVVGEQNKICSAGTHQGIEEKAEKQNKTSPYYSWDPSKYGHGVKFNYVIDVNSGRPGVQKKLEEMGYKVARDQLQVIYEQVMRLSESKNMREASEEEIAAIVQDCVDDVPYLMNITHCQAFGGSGTIPTAAVSMAVNGNSVTVTNSGDGTYDAVMKAVLTAAKHFFPDLNNWEIKLDDWKAGLVKGGGTEGLATVFSRIRVENNGHNLFTGHSVDLDTTQATAQSFANCLSWFLAHLESKSSQEELPKEVAV